MVRSWLDRPTYTRNRENITNAADLFNVLFSAAGSKEAKTAFLQSRPTTRKQKLCCRVPSDECFLGYHPKQFIMLLTEVYGLISGPAWWRRSLLEILVKELSYRVNVYDRCVLTLDGANDKGTTEGVIILEVDDILEAGTSKDGTA